MVLKSKTDFRIKNMNMTPLVTLKNIHSSVIPFLIQERIKKVKRLTYPRFLTEQCI